MDIQELEKRYSVALAIALETGKYLLEHENLRHNIEEKAVNDYVTSADKNAEDLIERRLKESFPEDSLFGEENGHIGKDGNKLWIIDPIDGTVDFMTGFPNYTVSIAFQDEDGIAIGVVYVVRQDEMFSALRGKGAFLNGKHIFTEEAIELNKQLAILVPPHRHHELLDQYISTMRKFYSYISDVRSLGSAACSLCYVAAGRCAMYYELGLKSYDCAAGIIIVREAGGKVTLIKDSESWIEIAASSSFCHDKMLEIIGD